MARLEISTKRLAIGKANTQMVIAVSVASFVTVFCLVASNAVWGQNKYQAKVNSAKEKAHHQLEENIKIFDQLAASYHEFDSRNPNVIGGNKNGSKDNDGTNSKIILDALPSTYDFPALTSSIEKILSDRGLKVSGIDGTDDQLSQQDNTSSPDPEAVEVPFSFTVESADYDSVKTLTSALEHSIRPIVIDSLEFSGGDNDMSVIVTAHTYYQPAKSVSIIKEVVE